MRRELSRLDAVASFIPPIRFLHRSNGKNSTTICARVSAPSACAVRNRDCHRSLGKQAGFPELAQEGIEVSVDFTARSFELVS